MHAHVGKRGQQKSKELECPLPGGRKTWSSFVLGEVVGN